MKFKKKLIYNLAVTTILTTSLFAQGKHLLLDEGNYWLPLMAPNLISNHLEIEKLPFSGFVMVGNSFTKEVMKENTELQYDYVWHEVKGLKNLYQTKKHNFMQINMEFPADFWDDRAWNKVTKNFAIMARVAKDLGFRGLVFDDEPYTPSSHKMNNFKFPTSAEVAQNPNAYSLWEKKGSEPDWVDKKAYRNKNHSFKEHMDKVKSRFKTIMQVMADNYPDLTLLVYNGPSFAHVNSNKPNVLVINVGLPREHEYKGAIFAGLQQGLKSNVSLHDLGESYRYRTQEHFRRAYQWRKFDIAKDLYNRLDESHQWVIPQAQRASWSNDVDVGFMVFNKPQNSSHLEYDTRNKSSLQDIQATLEKALHFSDKYVVYYCQDQDWLLPNQQHPLPNSWMKMMHHVYKKGRSMTTTPALKTVEKSVTGGGTTGSRF